MPGGDGALYFVDEARGCVYCIMFGLGTKLVHGEEIVLLDVKVDALSYYLLKEFAGAFKKGNGSVCLGEAVVWLLGFVNHNNCGGFLGVDAYLETEV